jgi:maleylacetoacetate isomerase
MVVPALIDGDVRLFQSLAILEYLDEKYPEPPLLPTDPQARAWVRGLALINVADSHPLIVPRVRHYLTDVLKVSDDQRLAWIQHWLGAGLEAIETLLAEHSSSGRFCHGESPTVADICLVTQVTPAKTFNLSLDPYPRVMRVYDLHGHPGFRRCPPVKAARRGIGEFGQLLPDLLLLLQRPLSSRYVARAAHERRCAFQLL